MSETADLLAAVRRLAARAERGAIVTVVAVRGSTYRRPGARLLVPEDGEPLGSISGGCLEASIVEDARAAVRDGRPALVSFDLTAEDDAVWGLGLGCNGAVDVFVEPLLPALLDSSEPGDAAAPLRLALDDDPPLAVVTAIASTDASVAPGARLIVRRRSGGDLLLEGSLGSEATDRLARDAVVDVLAEGRATDRTLASNGAEVRTFVELIDPPARLVICGAGRDAAPLVRGARALGWRALLVDDRASRLVPEHFPGASALVAVDAPEEAAKATAANEHTFVVLMNHDFSRDAAYARAFLASPARYIGILGPAGRSARMLAELDGEGIRARDDDRIHAPVGLDVGAEGPDEIAASILAEVIAVRRGGAGGFLRDRAGPIHGRATEGVLG